jgi:threonine/homoserine/homoserine lactone efflux protein
MGSVVALVLTSLAIMGSPGPATISLVAAGSSRGVRRSLVYLAGIIAGTATVLATVATGVTAVLLAVPALGPVLTWTSGAYILWLAYRIATAPPLSSPAGGSDGFSFVGGVVLGVANPKGWVAIGAVFASAHLARTPTADAAAKVGVLALMIVVICATWLVAGTSIAPLLRDARRARTVNVALAVALVGTTALAVLH